MTSDLSAIKVYGERRGYLRELAAYQRIEDRQLEELRGFKIPRIQGWSNELMVLEMSIVHVPCLLDFGGAYLDFLPEHALRDDEWHQEKAEEFGDNWEEAKLVITELEIRGEIFLSDVNTGNIKFPAK